MTLDKKDDFSHVFNLSKYMFIDQSEAGSAAFDLLQFLYDLRDLPNYQADKYAEQNKSFEESEHIGDMIYTTQIIADSFLMVAPILLYRLIETYLKKYLLILYEKNTAPNYKDEIMGANINTIKKLYKDSSAHLDITQLDAFKIIEEIRELNNSLKHNHDLVSKKLAEKNSVMWKEKEHITVKKIQDRIADFDGGIGSFFAQIVIRVRPFFPE